MSYYNSINYNRDWFNLLSTFLLHLAAICLMNSFFLWTYMKKNFFFLRNNMKKEFFCFSCLYYKQKLFQLCHPTIRKEIVQLMSMSLLRLTAGYAPRKIDCRRLMNCSQVILQTHSYNGALSIYVGRQTEIDLLNSQQKTFCRQFWKNIKVMGVTLAVEL